MRKGMYLVLKAVEQNQFNVHHEPIEHEDEDEEEEKQLALESEPTTSMTSRHQSDGQHFQARLGRRHRRVNRPKAASKEGARFRPMTTSPNS